MQIDKRAIFALGFLTLGACAVPSMKAPPGVASAKPLKVEGYSGSVKTFSEKDIKLGSYSVANIDRDWDKGSGMSAGPWSKETQRKAYRYDVKSQSRTLHGECTEQASSNGIAGFSKVKVTFGCTCQEGDSTRGKLDVVDGAGTAQVGEALYKVLLVHESETGSNVSGTLGYHFQGPEGEGAVDVGGTGRAWLPAGADEENSFTLACEYAGLLLYRPTT